MVSDEMKQELLEQHRDINVNYDWWDCVYEDFKQDMQDKCIEVTNMYFSGFWSQGDGACFVGVIPVSQIGKFMDLHDLSGQYPAGRYFAERHDLRGDLYKTTNHYSHENTVDFSLRDYTGNPYSEDTPRWEIYDTMQTLFETEYAQLELDIRDILRGYMQDLYSRLQKEYEYLTSEEVVWESIVANDLHKEVA